MSTHEDLLANVFLAFLMCFCKAVTLWSVFFYWLLKISVTDTVTDRRHLCCTGVVTTMNFQSAINKEIFVPCDERLLVAVEVQRRKRRRRMSFLSLPRRDYKTYICVSGWSPRFGLFVKKIKQKNNCEVMVNLTRRNCDTL